MYGQHPRFRRGGGGGRGAALPAQQGQHLNPNIFSNSNLFHLQHNPNLLPHFNPFLQNPSNVQFQQSPSNFPPTQQIPNSTFPNLQIPNTNCSNMRPHNNNSTSHNNNNNKLPQQQHPQGKLLNEAIERVDRAVVKVRGDLLSSKENVSVWKVSQDALLMVKADSWESLGFRMQQVPSLNRLLVTEGKINAFIHCFVAARRISSLYDLDVAICENEAIGQFEELELGPLVRHPLAMHYFSVSSDVAEVPRITSEEIISYLFEFMDTQQRKLKVDVFLDFIAKKQSVSNKERLCVRIQNLRTYATHIRQARQSEDRALEKCLEKMKKDSAKGGRKRPLFSAQKKQLDDHFGSISQRIKLFSSENGNFFGKHTRFVSSSSDDDDDDDDDSDENECEDYKGNNTPSNCSTLLPNLRADRVSSCPYPSAAEEMTRLGLKSDVNGSPCAPSDSVRCCSDIESSQRKRKSENISFKASSPRKLHKREKFERDIKRKGFSNQGTNDYLLANDSLRMFITTWKEACRGNSVDEVLERMLLIYNTRKKKKVKALFTSYPCVGLLNVAVTSMKFGMWDSMYDTFQAFSQQDVAGNISENSADCISIDVGQAEKDISISGQKTLKHEHGVTVEDIVNKLSGYFDDDDITSYENPSPEKKFLFLRKLSECKSWLMKKYSVKKFEFLGYGEYYMFLEKHMHLLPHALRKCLIGDTNENDPLEACIQRLQLDVLLSQASNSLWENESVSMQNVSELLRRQYPLVSFKLVKSDLTVNIGHCARELESNLTSKCLMFSAPLLKPRCVRDSLSQNEKKTQEASDYEIYVPKEGFFGTVRTKDAIEVLLRAPMLADLDLWSHWDLVFAPSLGPIVEWLLNEVNTKELLFLATKDGKIIRVDHSATIDSFLKVFIEGSSFETAVQLLSLYVLYGGERHVPLSLLKCHARQAFEVIINNLTDMEEDQKPFHNQHIVDKSSAGNLTINLHKNKNTMNKVIPVASSFVLDCLSYFPPEFCSSAADVLLSGLQHFVKDASSIILTACKQIEKRLMLHEIGISLGIVEWVNDYHSFRSSLATETLSSGSSFSSVPNSESNTGSTIIQDILNQVPLSLGDVLDSNAVDRHDGYAELDCSMADPAEVLVDGFAVNPEQRFSVRDNHIDYDPAGVIESIRREEFGLDQNLSVTENKMLEKQHARLGRALHCLSQELYSQDSHFLLELVQNADDNIYLENVEPTLTFILQETGIIVLNNEQGFSANNIRALCDVGNSTKKGQNAGYIGKKGIGFKSVFRVTDAPEIHSNGFHLKFDITEGQIGFVLPTIVPPCNIDMYTRLASADTDKLNCNSWNTCIVLPFRLNLSKGLSVNNIISMFSDLHPSLLLFLHRLQCIKFRNILDDSLIVMRKEVVGDGIIKVAIGNEKMTWLVVSQKLQAHVVRPDVQTTEISIAFTLQETVDGELVPILNQQPVFSFLPLRTYGLKFIIQGDFILPSSREEVDGNSPWNQWLLSEFPGLFVGAKRSFCDLPCFRGRPGKAVAAFMSFIPLLGEVHGFFASLPRMILSKLRLSNCLLLEGDKKEWVPPCRVLRNWTDQARSLLPDSLLREHLGLGYLNKDIILSDTLAVALGVDDYGPKILLKVIISLCCSNNGLKSMGFSWLSSYLSSIYVLSSHSFAQTPSCRGTGSDFTHELRKTPFIPLSDGNYGSVEEGAIWLHSDVVGQGINDESVFKVFPRLYDRLRIVSPNLISAAASVENLSSDATTVENVTRLLYRVGVQQLSDHEIVKVHILPALSGGGSGLGQEELMTEYLSFVMFHLQSDCTTCSLERGDIILELRDNALILTNYGYKRLSEVPIHFSRNFGNPVDVNKLIIGLDVKWHEIDTAYLKHPVIKLVSGGMLKWRNFFLEIGVTDFVKIVQVEKCISEMSHDAVKNMMWNGDMFSMNSVAKNWESEELFDLLSNLSLRGNQEKCKYFLEVLDTLWDDYFSDKVTGYCIDSTGGRRSFKSSLISVLHDVSWIVSSIDNELHYPKDLFHDCTAVNTVLGVKAPYAIPKVRSRKLVDDIGLKTQVTLDDALSILKVWRRSDVSFNASISQMSDFYTFIWKEMSTSKQKILEELHSGPFIFVPCASGSSCEDAIPGAFLSPQEVYWYDSTGSMDQMKLNDHASVSDIASSYRKMLRNLYPNLHDFFVNECGVDEIPPFRSYLQILLHLSTNALPHQAAKTVFQVFLKWGDAIKSGSMSLEDVEYLQDGLLKKEYAVLPTGLDKWVSLHPSYGLVCWCDDDALGREFKHLGGVNFLYFGEFPDDEHAVLQAKILIIMNRLRIPALSKIVTREAIYYGPADCSFIFSLVNWALPYAQRYILNAHPDKFLELKQSNFEDLRRLQIVVVEKLFYRNVIKSKITSKKRHECSCVLQDNILYCSRESDSHSIFMELSRLLYDGTPELHFANFLHMITTMTESGSTEEQIEFFILNSQKVPKLPPEEPEWFLSLENNATLQENSVSENTEEQNATAFKRRPGINSNWPPADWKTAPGFTSACRTFGFNTPAGSSLQQTTKRDDSKEILENSVVEVGSKSILDGDPLVITPKALQNAEISVSQFNLASNAIDSDMNVALDSVDPIDSLNFGSSNSVERDHLSVHSTNAQQALFTGRLGESVAFKYFTEKAGGMFVNWVNEANESGLPYDITIGDDENREYIEVKATKSARKNWFVISMREWQFAVEKGESFSIAHVTLSGNEMAKITIYKNPARLCKLGNLKLAMLVPNCMSRTML